MFSLQRWTKFGQETQLLLTNRATRLTSVKVTKHGTIPYVTYGFLLVSYCNFFRKKHRFEIFDFKNAVILKTGLRVRECHWKCHHPNTSY